MILKFGVCFKESATAPRFAAVSGSGWIDRPQEQKGHLEVPRCPMTSKPAEDAAEALCSLLPGYMFFTIASPNAEHFTSVAPCINRAKSYVTIFA
jgi:hypothetical protein